MENLMWRSHITSASDGINALYDSRSECIRVTPRASARVYMLSHDGQNWLWQFTLAWIFDHLNTPRFSARIPYNMDQLFRILVYYVYVCGQSVMNMCVRFTEIRVSASVWWINKRRVLVKCWHEMVITSFVVARHLAPFELIYLRVSSSVDVSHWHCIIVNE